MTDFVSIERSLDYTDLALSEAPTEIIENQAKYADGVAQGMKMAVRIQTSPDYNADELLASTVDGDRESVTEILTDRDKVIGMLIGVLEGSRLIKVVSASGVKGNV